MSNSLSSSKEFKLWERLPEFGSNLKAKKNKKELSSTTPEPSKSITTKVDDSIKVEPNQEQAVISVSNTNAGSDSQVIQATTGVDDQQRSEAVTLDLNREQKYLRPYQDNALYRINSQSHSVTAQLSRRRGFTLSDLLNFRLRRIPTPFHSETKLETINFLSTGVTSLSGKGLTIILANKALANMEKGQSSIVLANSKYQRQRIAQSMIDFTPRQNRGNLAARIVIIDSLEDLNNIRNTNSNTNGITYIISTDVLKNLYDSNESFQPVTNNLGTISLEHRRLNEYIPLNEIKEILVDDVHEYTGFANDGYCKILLSLLRETNSHTTDPTALIGFSSTPYQREEGSPSSRRFNDTLIDFQNLFPPLSQIVIPGNYEESEGPLKKVAPSTIQLTGTISTGESINQALRQLTNHNLLIDTLGTIQADSINAQLVKEIKAHYQPGQKWRIIADSADHAELLCQLLTANIPQANPKIFIGRMKGSYQSEATGTLQAPVYGDDGSELRREILEPRRETESNVLNDFESTGETSSGILVELEALQKYHNPQVTHVVHANFINSEIALLRALGHACTTDAQGGIMNQWFLDPRQLERCQDYLRNGVQLTPISKDPDEPLGGIGPVNIAEVTRVTARIAQEALHDAHVYWLERGLAPLISTNYPGDSLDDALTKIASTFNGIGKSINEIKEIIQGRKIDHDLFRQFLILMTIKPEDVAVYAPELVGIKNEQQAKKSFAFAFREMMNNRNFTEQINWNWHDYLDKHLGIVPALPYDRSLAIRSKKFAELIYDKFGPKYFEDRAFVRHIIQVFSGITNDTKLIGLLINSIPRMNFRDTRELFPNLTGQIPHVSFERLQNLLVNKYPDGPALDLDTFFKQTIYDDLGIDFATLVNSITDYHLGSDQTIITNSAKNQIAEYLANISKERATGNGNSLNQQTNHLNEITRQVLYNQILAKVWGINRNVVITDNDFNHNVHADRIESSIQAESPLERRIDLVNSNLAWVAHLDKAIQSKFTSQELSLNLKTRLAFAIDKFINKSEHSFNESIAELKSTEDDIDTRTELRNHKTTLARTTSYLDDEHLINILSGAVHPNKLTKEDQDLLREFAQSFDMNLDELIPEFPTLLGIRNVEEATLLVNQVLGQVDRSKFNADLAKLTKNSTTNSELIGEYLFTKHPDALLDKESLQEAIKLINGDYRDSTSKAEGQAYLRAYISFLEDKTKDSPSPIELIDVVTALPKLTGIFSDVELIAAAKSEERFDINEAVSKSGNGRTINYVKELGTELGLSLNDMAVRMKLEDPVKFYAEPIRLISNQTKAEIPPFAENQKEAILSRNILKSIWGEDYMIIADNGKKDIPTVIDIAQDSKTSKTTETLYVYNNKFELRFEKKGTTMTVLDTYSSEYKNGAWQSVIKKTSTKFDDDKTRKLFIEALEKQNRDWYRKLMDHLSPLSIEEVITKISEFNEKYPDEMMVISRPSSLDIAFGNEATITKDPKNQEIFRKWLDFIGMDLSEVIAEFPKLTGVRSLAEMRLFTDKNYPDAEINRLRVNPRTHPAEFIKFVFETAIPASGLTVSAIKEFPDYKELKVHYLRGIEANHYAREEGIDGFLSREDFPDASLGFSQQLIAFDLFPNYVNNHTRPLSFCSSPEDQLKHNYSKLIVHYNFLDYFKTRGGSVVNASDAWFDDRSKSWISHQYGDSFIIFGNLYKTILKGNPKLSQMFLDILKSSPSIPEFKQKAAWFRLVDNFLNQLPSAEFLVSDEQQKFFVSASLVGDKQIFGDSQKATAGLEILKSFIKFADSQYPGLGFAKLIDTDEELRKILEIGSTAQTPEQIAIDAIKSKGKEWWLEQIQAPSQLVKTFNDYLTELNPSLNLDSFLNFYSINKYGDIYSALSGITNTLWGLPMSIDNNAVIDRVSVVAILSKIFNDSRNFMIIAGGRTARNADEGNIFTTNGINYAQELHHSADGTNKVLRELKLIGGLLIEMTPTADNKPSPQEIINIIRALKLPDQLEGVDTESALNRVLSNAAQNIGLSVKDMFDLLGIGFMIDNQGIDQQWYQGVKNFVLDAAKQQGHADLAVLHKGQVIAIILKALIKDSEKNNMDDIAVSFLILLNSAGSRLDLALCFTKDKIQLQPIEEGNTIVAQSLSERSLKG